MNIVAGGIGMSESSGVEGAKEAVTLGTQSEGVPGGGGGSSSHSPRK